MMLKLESVAWMTDRVVVNRTEDVITFETQNSKEKTPTVHSTLYFFKGQNWMCPSEEKAAEENRHRASKPSSSLDKWTICVNIKDLIGSFKQSVQCKVEWTSYSRSRQRLYWREWTDNKRALHDTTVREIQTFTKFSRLDYPNSALAKIPATVTIHEPVFFQAMVAHATLSSKHLDIQVQPDEKKRPWLTLTTAPFRDVEYAIPIVSICPAERKDLKKSKSKGGKPKSSKKPPEHATNNSFSLDNCWVTCENTDAETKIPAHEYPTRFYEAYRPHLMEVGSLDYIRRHRLSLADTRYVLSKLPTQVLCMLKFRTLPTNVLKMTTHSW